MVKEKGFYRTLFKIALPVAFQSLLSVSVNLLDNLMVSSLGDAALSSVAMANQITVFLSFFIRGVGGASSLMISQYWGKGDISTIRKIYTVVLRFAGGLIAVVALLLAIFPKPVMSLFLTDDSLLETSAMYLRIICISYIFQTLSETIAAMLRSVEAVSITLYLTLISLFSNLIFNYIFIFGKFGVPAMGVKGAALATVTARIIEFCFALVYLFAIEKKIRFRPAHLLQKTDGLFRDFVKFGLPVIIGDLQWGLVGTVKSIPVGRLGEVMISANSIAETIMSLCFAFSTGMASAACVVIGKSVGSGDYKETKEYSKTIQVIFACIAVTLGALLFLFRSVPVGFFKDISDEAREYAKSFLAVGAASLPGTCFHVACFTGINRGAGDTKFVFKVDLVCGWLIVVPLTFLLGTKFFTSYTLVYFATRADQFVKWLIALIRLNTSDRWIKNITAKTTK